MLMIFNLVNLNSILYIFLSSVSVLFHNIFFHRRTITREEKIETTAKSHKENRQYSLANCVCYSVEQIVKKKRRTIANTPEKMSVDLNKNRNDIIRAWKDVVDSKTDTDW